MGDLGLIKKGFGNLEIMIAQVLLRWREVIVYPIIWRSLLDHKVYKTLFDRKKSEVEFKSIPYGSKWLDIRRVLDSAFALKYGGDQLLNLRGGMFLLIAIA